MIPVYLALRNTGELAQRAETPSVRLRACDHCPRRCGVDRTHSADGVCPTGALVRVSSTAPHFADEAQPRQHLWQVAPPAARPL
ncbi:MAG: hypothetical protein A3K19_06230 [Lentisphaerae bacterium RIFOXYB12_FULL_65_16]|nr:MAG: hypothetical protein A3K18_30970 [Lentisphaerae bacterium RIFOXYA12_64_32]OGV91994.1 MAG: hypothetical protein A3K19_06230 [Lentisphaerae bacterium RIFOXYB12_FULL_65_16]